MSADLLVLLDRDPAQGILAVADLRELRANTIPGWDLRETDEGHEIQLLPEDHSGSYEVQFCEITYEHGLVRMIPGRGGDNDQYEQAERIAEHIAAEANPAHVLTAVRRWREVVERHGDLDHYCVGRERFGYWKQTGQYRDWIAEPCPDLIKTAEEARAYLGTSS